MRRTEIYDKILSNSFRDGSGGISMNRELILRAVDHTILCPTATWKNVQRICDEAIEFETASVCVPPAFVKRVKAYVGSGIPICTVIGFPNGYQTVSSKAFEADDVLKKGADEIDMMINLGDLRDRNYASLKNEIKTVKLVCGKRILKVTVEACLLTEGEKIRMCEIVSEADADYIKTSTGFSTGGADPKDVALFAKHLRPGVKIKAAGGISDFEFAQKLLQAGAFRLGSSRLVGLAKEIRNE